MKRILSFALSMIMVLTVLTMAPTSVSFADAPPYGDVDQDNSVSAADALAVLKNVVGKLVIEGELFEYADVDDDDGISANDALMILKYVVGKIDQFPADKGTEGKDDLDLDNMTMDEIVAELDGANEASAINDYYKIHNDGGLIYDALSREMDQGEKTKYNVAKKTTGSFKLDDGTTISYSLPTDVTAYDMIPIEYKVQGNTGSDPVYVEATTFEDKDGSFYDLALPGTVSVKADYLGYVAGTNNPDNRPYLSANFQNDVQGKKYPQYETTDLIASDTVPSGKPLWFKFRFTNTGNTILDGDGNGTFCFEPHIIGNGKDTGHTNLYVRLKEDLYPGESTDLWIYFGANSGMSLAAGDYTIKMNCLVRNEQGGPDWGTKIWGGYNYGTVSKDITVADNPTTTNKSAATYTQKRTVVRDTWVHTYEEFTTSYDAWLNPEVDLKGQTNTLWVQSAAWSDRVVLKLMRGNGINMKSVTIPLNVETDSIKIKLNETANNFITKDNGKKYPAMASQTMCDMRVNDSNSPYSNEAQLDELFDMKDCGVNLVTTTEAFNIETANKPTGKVNNNTDAIWFVSDALRKLGMRMEGYTGYSYHSGTTMSAAFWYSQDSRVRGSVPTAFGNEALDIANGLRGLYQFMRWGDNYYIDGTGKPVINTEDTRGWMRIDFNARFVTDDETLTAFQKWIRRKYKNNLDALNEAWSTGNLGYSYTDWSEIDPTEGTTDDHGWDSHVTGSATLPEWSAGLADWDMFRTIQRTQNYETVLDVFKNYNTNVKDLGAASVDVSMGIRTEGGNITGIVDPNTKSSHLRHAYYSQRRCAIVPEILAKSGVVSMHSDYVTLPFSVKELEELVASSTKLGITNMPLFQASRMRDIAINSEYGDDAYGVHYNLTGANTKGAYINTQISMFTAYKAVYENGGIPGVLWQDYLCDGYVTETQQKEMKFYSSKIAEMMETDEAKTWATTNVPDIEAIYAKSNGVYSYNEDYITAEIAATAKRRAAEGK
ncbi:MAG: beta-galactosidase [Clostridia bacterium]|nr:beta-galactosidase [Clostridia bacterium]